MELDFRGCKTKEDVEKVFDKKEDDLVKDIDNIGKLRVLFFEEDEAKTKSEDGIEKNN